jgi:aspartate/methionine/tyrosine aminotransferase
MSAAVRINQNVLEMEYAVRGPIPQRAAELARQGMRTIPCNIGNPQALGQPPISYYRQVLSLVEDPQRIVREQRLARADLGGDTELIAEDVLATATEIISQLATGMGAYTESAGFRFIRQAVAGFIDRRDEVTESNGVRSDPDRIFLTNGASEGAKYILEMLISGPDDGVMIPIPQYPLYSAAIRKCGGVQVNYYPDEDSGWSLDRSMIEEPLLAAKQDGINVKAIVVINPANPTGAILDEQCVRDVVEVAAEHGLAIIADEVYQDNLYGHDWVSFARVLGSRDIPLFSLHSVSKGFYGECGHRGGYLEVRNPPALAGTDLSFMDVLLKQASVSLCSNTSGQVLNYLMVRPPEPGSPSYQRFSDERARVLADLHDKATMIRNGFKEMEGVECFGRIGAMYLFPRLNRLPAGSNDFDYCMSLLEETGICTVNGAGFGQREGTSHLRIAFLPPKGLIEEVLPQWIEFHNRYVG